MKNRWFFVVACVITAIIICALSVLVYMPSRQLSLDDCIGFFVIVGIFFLILSIYVCYMHRSVLSQRRKTLALSFSMIVSYSLLLFFKQVITLEYSVYAAPFALCGLLVALLVSRRCGFFANLMITFIFFFAEHYLAGQKVVDLQYPLFVGVITGVIGAYAITTDSRRIQYVLLGVMIGFISAVVAVIMILVFNAVPANIIKQLTVCLLAFISGAVNICLFFMFIPLFEWMFNITTNFRLAELTSSNRPLIKRLKEEAPGTYYHSLALANYAEACALAIGENPVLARAAGYYHDIGKLYNPKYFIENQGNLAENPHDALAPEVSVRLIRSHVAKGVLFAKENRLPDELQKAIEEHHGSMPIKVFYYKANRITEGTTLDISEYSYSGPIPTSKISAIIMIADASEAALRAQKHKENAAAVIESIVRDRLELGQFANCDITMHELEIIKRTILTQYLSLEHDRITYPSGKK